MKDFSPLSITSNVVGFPARLCVITRRDGRTYRVAESDEAITVDGDTYSSVAGLSISAVKHTANGEMPSCQITSVHGNSSIINSVDLDIGLFDGAAVQLYTVDRLDLSRKGLLFTGVIGNTSYNTKNQVVFDVKGAASQARVLMTPRRTPMCRTDLFSTLCGLNSSSYAVSATVAAILDAFNFTVSGLAQADTYFNQGVVVTDSNVAFEVANWVNSSQQITSYLPCNRVLTVGGNITLYPGCDKTLSSTGCGKFSNQLNFQGEPHFLGSSAASQQV